MKKKLFIISLIFLFTGSLLGYWLGRSLPYHSSLQQKPLYWVDSMEPTIHYPGPGQSRMGMTLTPVYAEDNQGNASGIYISPNVINNLGIRTASVIKGKMVKRIETVGFVEPNANNFSHVHTYAEGWIRKLFVKAVGEPIQPNQILLQLYSPTLINVQEEYLLALESKNQALIDASYKRLQSFHVSEQQIQRLKASHKASQLIDIYPHQGGILTDLSVQEGMHVTPATEIMNIVDLSNVWIIAQVFEEQGNWIKIGDKADARLSAFPEKIWQGKVDYIYPQLDAKTRSVQVRIRFDNPDNILKPNMYATISLLVKAKPNVLSIPIEALIRSGSSTRVIVALKDNRFTVREVTTGLETTHRVEILSGLKEGENVVVSGQFLLDSETNLKAGLERIDPSFTSPKQENK